MAYQRKTQDVWQIHVNYGYGHGWEYECGEESRAAGKERLREYRENCDYPVRMICKREKIEESEND